MWWIIGILGAVLFLACLRFTKVEEGTAKAIVRLGAFRKIVMAWKDYELDEKWNVKPVSEIGRKLHLPGGLRFVGFWPLDKVYKYKFRWQGIEIVEGKEKVEFHEKTIDYILVRPDVYWTQILGAETGPVETPERIPLDIQWLVTMRVMNPYKTLFKAPPNWVENILARLNAHFRDWVATKSLDEILALRKQPATLLEDLKGLNRDLFEKVFKEEWGVLIEGIQIRDITLPAPYKEAAARRKQLELEAEARRTQFEIEAKARATEIMGTVIEAVVTASGGKREEVEEEFRKNPEEFYRKHKTVIDNVMTKLSMEERAYLRIETPGATEFEGALLRLIGAWQRMPRGREGRRRENSTTRRLSDEEHRKIVREAVEKNVRKQEQQKRS
jgi:regulator of protease activity HflC (stomatin/prohibitin superfamily)